MKPQRVYTAGTFDAFHWGHVEFLKRCARLGDVTVALNTDEFVERYKKQRPLIDYDGRRRVLEACRWVTSVVPQDSECLLSQLERLRPDYLVVGSDWARKNYYEQIHVTQWGLDELGIILCYVPYTGGISTTEIRRRLAA